MRSIGLSCPLKHLLVGLAATDHFRDVITTRGLWDWHRREGNAKPDWHRAYPVLSRSYSGERSDGAGCAIVGGGRMLCLILKSVRGVRCFHRSTAGSPILPAADLERWSRVGSR